MKFGEFVIRDQSIVEDTHKVFLATYKDSEIQVLKTTDGYETKLTNLRTGELMKIERVSCDRKQAITDLCREISLRRKRGNGAFKSVRQIEKEAKEGKTFDWRYTKILLDMGYGMCNLDSDAGTVKVVNEGCVMLGNGKLKDEDEFYRECSNKHPDGWFMLEEPKKKKRHGNE